MEKRDDTGQKKTDAKKGDQSKTSKVKPTSELDERVTSSVSPRQPATIAP